MAEIESPFMPSKLRPLAIPFASLAPWREHLPLFPGFGRRQAVQLCFYNSEPS